MKKHHRDQEFIDKVRQRIIEIRKEKGLTQEDLVQRTGFDLKQIGRIERGESNTTLSSIAAIARALEVHPKELFEFEWWDNKNYMGPLSSVITILCGLLLKVSTNNSDQPYKKLWKVIVIVGVLSLIMDLLKLYL